MRIRVALTALLFACITTQLCVGIGAAQVLRLEVNRSVATGKPQFVLNREPFYPVLYSEHYATLTPGRLDDLRRKGFNALQVAVDTEEVTTPAFQKLMELCGEEFFPVFLEIHEWSFGDVLKDRSELNMFMSHGEPVQHFPDYANPETRRLHLDRYRQAAKNISPYVHRPIVAVSVGAYDAYHLPDDERHADFVVPRHDRPFQTRLPFGRWSLEAYRRYLADAGIDHGSLPIDPPESESAALSKEHWHHWILFRRELVSSWLCDTIDVVREQTGLLVGVSLDLKFAQRERFATPVFQWSNIVDFMSVYCYGGKPSHRAPHRLPLMRENYNEADAEYVPDLMRTAWREYSQVGVPLIGFLEFSSGLAGETPGDAYARQCAPFVSGLMTTGPHPKRKHDQQRIDSFVEWIVEQGGPAELLQRMPAPARFLLVVHRKRIYADHAAQRELARHKIPFDVEYASFDWKGTNNDQYECVVVDCHLSLPASNKADDVLFLREAELPTWILNKVKNQ